MRSSTAPNRAAGLGYLALDIPARNIPTISEERTAEGPHHPIENTRRGLVSRHARFCSHCWIAFMNRCGLAEVGGRVFDQISG